MVVLKRHSRLISTPPTEPTAKLEVIGGKANLFIYLDNPTDVDFYNYMDGEIEFRYIDSDKGFTLMLSIGELVLPISLDINNEVSKSEFKAWFKADSNILITSLIDLKQNTVQAIRNIIASKDIMDKIRETVKNIATSSITRESSDIKSKWVDGIVIGKIKDYNNY